MNPNRYVRWLQVAAALALVILLLPVLAAGAFVGRFVLLGLAAAALVGSIVLYAASPRFREWLAAFSAPEIQYKGMRLATDVELAPTHAWARADRDGVVVGSDDLAPTVLGPLSTVELPEIGRRFGRGEPFAHLRRGMRSIALRAPVSGVVVGRNEALHWRPELVNDEPYADGWMVRVRSESRRDEPSWLRRGRRARAWFRDETDRLVTTLLARAEQSHVLADGGQLVGQVYRQIDDQAWQRLMAAFFEGRVQDHAADQADRAPEAGR